MKGSDTVIKRLFFTLELQTTLEIGIFSDSDSDAVEYFFVTLNLLVPLQLLLLTYWLVAWHSGRTSVSDRRTFALLRSTCG